LNSLFPVLTALLAAITLSVSAQEVLYAERVAPATFAEMEAWPVAPRAPRTIEQRTFVIPAFLGSFPGAAEPPRSVPTIAPPTVRSSFASGTSRAVSPGDASGAVGRTHLVSALNSGVIVHDRSGKILGQVTLEQFWGEPARVAMFYDPRIVYDAGADRWIVMSLDDDTTLRFAVTATGDPTGQWARYKLTLATTREETIDFSHLVLTRDTVVMATRRYYRGRTVFLSIRKPELYASQGSLAFKTWEPPGDLVPVDGRDSADEYAVQYNGVKLVIQKIDGTAVAEVRPRFGFETSHVYAPQPGTWLTIDAGWEQIENATLRNGVLWVVQRITALGYSSVLWWRVDPKNGTVLENGAVFDQPSHFAYPSIAVNDAGAMLVAFTVFSATANPSAAFVYRDPGGSVSGVARLHEGTTVYGLNNRWGDYTTTIADPLGDGSFWTLQLHAEDKTWMASWANVAADVPTVMRRHAVRH
jgi:hypothetical protein